MKSSVATVVSRAPKGTVRGPILFIILMNDMNESVLSFRAGNWFCGGADLARAQRAVRVWPGPGNW